MKANIILTNNNEQTEEIVFVGEIQETLKEFKSIRYELDRLKCIVNNNDSTITGSFEIYVNNISYTYSFNLINQ